MTGDVRTELRGGWVGEKEFKAVGDVEAFIEDDLRTEALDLRYLFTLFPRRYRGWKGGAKDMGRRQAGDRKGRECY